MVGSSVDCSPSVLLLPVLHPQRGGCVTTVSCVFFSDIPAVPAFYLPFWAFLSTKLAFYRSNHDDSKIPFLTGNKDFGLLSLYTLLSTHQTLNLICHHWILISGVFCDSLQSRFRFGYAQLFCVFHKLHLPSMSPLFQPNYEYIEYVYSWLFRWFNKKTSLIPWAQSCFKSFEMLPWEVCFVF